MNLPETETITIEETPRRHNRSGRSRRNPIQPRPCEYTVTSGGTHPKGCVYIGDVELRQALKRRRVHKLARDARRAQQAAAKRRR